MEDVCSVCGATNSTDVQFCTVCGEYLQWSEDVVQTRPGTAVPVPVPGPRAPSPDPAEASTPVPAAPPTAAAPRTEEPVAARTATLEVAPRASGTAVPCPACGHGNDPGLHFCSRCGQTLVEEPAAAPRSQDTAWRRMLEQRDRSARRAYRRSLPPLYRWRRVVIAVLVPVLVVGGLVAVGQHPVRWGQERWWDLRGTTVQMTGLTARTNPPEASARDSDPASLVDGTQQAWSEPWNPPAEGTTCGGASATGTAVLTFAPTRVRAIEVNAGLPAANPDRLLQFRPQAVGVRFDSGPCRSFTLADTADAQRLVVDSEVPVTSVSLGFDTTYPARSDGEPVLSITEITLWSRPS